MKKLVIYILVLLILVLTAERCLYNSFITAIEKEDKKRIESLQNFPYLSLNRCGGEGWVASFLTEIDAFSPLEAAAMTGNLEVARQLIQKGADADKTRSGHFAPVYLTIETVHENDLEMLKLLVENGASPTGMTSSSGLDEHSLQQISGRLVTSDQDSDDMTFTAGEYNDEVANQTVRIYRYLEDEIGKDAPVTEQGETVLMNTVSVKNLALVKYLLESGHEVNAKDQDGFTALFYLIDEEGIYYDSAWRKEVFQLLLQYGADLSVKDKENRTVYVYAEQVGDTFMADLISTYIGVRE